jgi:hypothetical protein
MKVQQSVSKITQKSDVVVFVLATLIVCTLVGKGIFSLCETEHRSLLHSAKK